MCFFIETQKKDSYIGSNKAIVLSKGRMKMREQIPKMVTSQQFQTYFSEYFDLVKLDQRIDERMCICE